MGNRNKIGICMEGGAMRGLFTAGILDVLMEQNISFDGAVGSSAGAVFGMNMKSGQIGRAIRYNKRFCKHPLYGTFRSFVRSGDLYDVDFCYHTIPDVLDIWDRKAFRENPMDFFITCTDATTGKAVHFQAMGGGEADLQHFRASGSIPVLSRVVKYDGNCLLDGGIADPIPYDCLKKQGYDKIVIVLTRPYGYVKKKLSLLPLIRHSLREFPRMGDALANRHLVYARQIEEILQMEAEGKVFVLRPPVAVPCKELDHNPKHLQTAYDMGREVMTKRLEALKKYLEA